VGRDLQKNAIGALVVGWALILIYITVRYEFRFAVAGVIGLVHDAFFTIGMMALLQVELDSSFVAAILTILGYSINDAVIIFDRIRETFRKQRKMAPQQVIDHAITSPISRPIIPHGSTQIMVLSMLLFGGPTLFYFALALTIGICFGIYSSVFVGAAMAMWLGIKREDLIKATSKSEGDPDDPNAGAVV
jgi:preprotein translocase subunit SecF